MGIAVARCHAVKADGDTRQEQIRVAAESDSYAMTVLDLCESGIAASELGCLLFCFSCVRSCFVL